MSHENLRQKVLLIEERCTALIYKVSRRNSEHGVTQAGLFQKITKLLTSHPHYFLARRIDHRKLIFPFIGSRRVNDHARVGEVPFLSLFGSEPRIGGRAAHAAQDVY
jgi:hypothetical protein